MGWLQIRITIALGDDSYKGPSEKGRPLLAGISSANGWQTIAPGA